MRETPDIRIFIACISRLMYRRILSCIRYRWDRLWQNRISRECNAMMRETISP